MGYAGKTAPLMRWRPHLLEKIAQAFDHSLGLAHRHHQPADHDPAGGTRRLLMADPPGREGDAKIAAGQIEAGGLVGEDVGRQRGVDERRHVRGVAWGCSAGMCHALASVFYRRVAWLPVLTASWRQVKPPSC